MHIGWRDISTEEALECGVPQAVRKQWQAWGVEVFGYGLWLCLRPKP